MVKSVLVTGASRGIGLAISNLLAASGYHVIGIARNSGSEPFPGTFFNCDLANIAATQTVLDEINRQFSDLCLIVNNVGIVRAQALGEIDFSSLNAVLDLNVRSAVQITQAFVTAMKAKQYGRIINITSRAILGAKNLSSYSASKSALLGLTRTWAIELAPFKITVNAVAPGPVETTMFRERRPVGSKEEAETLATIPLGRIGKPEEIAATVKFLLSDGAGFITGQNICVDGGSSL
ncbi:MAG: SDR family oxidoreductase [Burkholderiales bacterium]|nr:SDR family oxidoreductase [Burkholderiales bacterium]